MDRALELWGESFGPLLRATIQTTIPLTLISFVFALVLGIVVALVRYAKVPVLSQLAALYVWVFRGTPLLVQLFIVFYALPEFGVKIDPFLAAVIAWPVA